MAMDDVYATVRSLAHAEAHGSLRDMAEAGVSVNLEHLLIAVFMSGFHQAIVLGLNHPSVLTQYAVALAVVSDMDTEDQADLDANARDLARAVKAGLN